MRRMEMVDGMGALALRFAILTAARSGGGTRPERFSTISSSLVS
jgi:hypothetical protein